MVGDHLMDVISGKSAGMRTIGVLTDERGSDYFSSVEPDAVTPDLNEILRAIIHSNS
jgi:phosphoglycolate phosphatase-like HAD superfamily hydrolase